ncbi:Translation initiation factor IF-3 [Buchnera aphidicola (Pterocallis alni)]|uniref:translation initiation factor IF-3 n=1 Tax=Buchnera aphidicola TaxID=9 RepID=UPI0034647FA4
MKPGNRVNFIKNSLINSKIKALTVRLIGLNNEFIGIVPIEEALQHAQDLELDLVQISANANPCVCRIMDYGKFLYKKNKNLKEQRKKHKALQIKEIKFRPNTHQNDYQVKLKNLIRFLNKGNKVKVTLRFRGREMAHNYIGIKILNKIRSDLINFSITEYFPSKVEGRQMVMLLSPKKI